MALAYLYKKITDITIFSVVGVKTGIAACCQIHHRQLTGQYHHYDLQQGSTSTNWYFMHQYANSRYDPF